MNIAIKNYNPPSNYSKKLLQQPQTTSFFFGSEPLLDDDFIKESKGNQRISLIQYVLDIFKKGMYTSGCASAPPSIIEGITTGQTIPDTTWLLFGVIAFLFGAILRAQEGRTIKEDKRKKNFLPNNEVK